MTISLVHRIRQCFQKPPNVVARRMGVELRRARERMRLAWRPPRLTAAGLLRATSASSVDELWSRLASRPHAAFRTSSDAARTAADLERICPGQRARIMAAAEQSLAGRVDLLGSGNVWLGHRINWHLDYKSGLGWPCTYSWDLDYNNLDRPSDVKFAWELSRMHWLIPAAQAYLLTGDERYAAGVRDILQDWIDQNPPLRGVNWSCTMEIALRILTWTWLFHVFRASAAWSGPEFRAAMLACLYQHGLLVEQYLDYSDVNGNHCTADAVGLVFAGLFFGQGRAPRRWLSSGWRLLCDELPRQVFPDGVNFEASLPYHRLVLELFLLAALYRQRHQLEVPAQYRQRVIAMARFTLAYCRADGRIPLVGDGDDGRALPLGGQAINDHRYVPGLIGSWWGVGELLDGFSGPRDEIFWLLGADAAGGVPARDTRCAAAMQPQAFCDGGFFIMSRERDHVFIVCGPVGLAGRGGHGHNDCLSFDAVLAGCHLITDCGSYVYTASVAERNAFRSTAYHNTPQVDGEEINRIPAADLLWQLCNDAVPEVRCWECGGRVSRFAGAHAGYRRLQQPVTPVRTITLDHDEHVLEVHDRFEGTGRHRIEIPLHLAPGVSVVARHDRQLVLRSGGHDFLLDWEGDSAWTLEWGPGRRAPSYGVVEPLVRIAWHRSGDLAPLTVRLRPAAGQVGMA
jgi:uncharacterized heparinase superfamily protein